MRRSKYGLQSGTERVFFFFCSHWAIDLVETLLQSYPREAKADFIITGVRGSIKNIVWRSYRKTMRGENYS